MDLLRRCGALLCCMLGTTALSASEEIQPRDAFMARVSIHCGQAFAGRIVANEPPQPDDPFAGKALVMHVRECAPGVLKIPFHVGDDHSRTWVLTRTPEGLRLKHDHRHEDGSEDAVTQYGGDIDIETAGPRGTVVTVELPRA